MLTTADVVFLVDNSRSDGAITKTWLSSVVDDLDSSLRSAGIDARYGVVAFGEVDKLNPSEHRFAHSSVLHPDAVSAADRLFTFSEDVNVADSNLRLVGLGTANVPTLADFSYDIATMTVTWRFEGWAIGDHYLLSLSDAVTDVEGNRLDGEWKNPTSLTTTNPTVSEFPSGDDEAGGDFNFIATLLPGDANLDLIVDFDDFGDLMANYGSQFGNLFQDADFDGDGAVTFSDFQSLQANYYVDLQNLFVLADLDGDFDVDEVDLDTLAGNIGIADPTYEDGDLNGDGDITAADVDLMFAQWGLELEVVS